MTVHKTDACPGGGIGALVSAICSFLAGERPFGLLMILSFLGGCIFCLNTFDTGFLLGTSAFWDNPRSIVGRGWADISTALSGYLFYQQDAWQWPLFHISKLGVPAGTNIVFTDSIPWVTLAGRIAFRLSGVLVNFYGAWTAFCFVASAMSLTALVAAVGQRNLAVAAMATVTGLCMPALLARWGHISLMAQFEIPLALTFYLRDHNCGQPWRLFGQGAGLMWLALWTNAYLFVMVGAIVLATIGQAFSDRVLSATLAAFVLAGLVVVLGLGILLTGSLESRGGLGATGVGIFSMNLFSPFLPQYSGVFLPLRHSMADATGGQYEGFSYLGVGILALLWMTLPWQYRTLRIALRRHIWISALFAGFTTFALSNIIYLGPTMIAHVPLPEWALQTASMFRSTGRFFWPVMYSMAALAIAAPIALYGRYGTLLLCLAIPLQWVDSGPLRQLVAASTRAPDKPHIDRAAWRSAIKRHDSIRVLPQNFCLLRPLGWNSEVTMQLQLLAAFANRPINTIYAARLNADCRGEQRIDGTPRLGTRQLSAFLDEFSSFSRMQVLAATSTECSAGNGLVVCSDIHEESPALAALAQTDRK